jgi:methionyl-tRNA formyltransferase
VACVAFLGSPEAAVPSLQALVEGGHDVVLVVTEADKRRGRGTAASPTPVKRLAAQLGLPVSEDVADVLEAGADLGVVVAFGRLIPASVLERLLMVNVHFSLLPRWRGAAPVERAILAGDEQTGVSLMRLDEGLDTGPVYACQSTPIGPQETAAELRERLARLGAELLISRLSGGVEGLGLPVPQAGEATYARKITPEDLRIDWRRSASEIERQVRVGRAWTTFRRGRLIVWEAAETDAPELAGERPSPGTLLDNGVVTTGRGWIELRVVQPEGRQRQRAADWMRGARLGPGEALG